MALPTTAEPKAAKPRDSAHTRQLLLHSARARFARDGYSGTTVRDIATDAGVNVALINRYFSSKEGLFEECLTIAAEGLNRPDGESATLDHVLTRMTAQVASAPSSEQSLQLLLLLRSSGDERADQIRRNTLLSYAQKLATVAGWRPGDADRLVLRAQIAIATGLGIALLRASAGIEPLASATMADLEPPLGDVFRALLAPSDG